MSYRSGSEQISSIRVYDKGRFIKDHTDVNTYGSDDSNRPFTGEDARVIRITTDHQHSNVCGSHGSYRSFHRRHVGIIPMIRIIH